MINPNVITKLNRILIVEKAFICKDETKLAFKIK